MNFGARLSHGIACLMATVCILAASTSLAEDVTRSDAANAWRFKVYLDDQEIGYHHFYLDGNGSLRQLRSVASFEYRLMFIRLFHYEHENREVWNGDCLLSLDSQTDSNGDQHKVDGQAAAGGFQVSGNTGDAVLPECVMSFAYWNPAFLEQSRLLNTQDGQFLDVEISDPVFEELEVRGKAQPSYRYRLAAGALNLDLWYSTDHEWLGLKSEVRGGRELRYELL